jgi:hypothetical protein
VIPDGERGENRDEMYAEGEKNFSLIEKCTQELDKKYGPI